MAKHDDRRAEAGPVERPGPISRVPLYQDLVISINDYF